MSVLMGALLVIIILIAFVLWKFRCQSDDDCSSCGSCWTVPGSGGKVGACIPENPAAPTESMLAGIGPMSSHAPCATNSDCGTGQICSPSGCIKLMTPAQEKKYGKEGMGHRNTGTKSSQSPCSDDSDCSKCEICSADGKCVKLVECKSKEAPPWTLPTLDPSTEGKVSPPLIDPSTEGMMAQAHWDSQGSYGPDAHTFPYFSYSGYHQGVYPSYAEIDDSFHW